MWPLSLSRNAPRIDDARWIVLDVESSGLDAARDRLLAMAAVSVRHDGRRAWIDLADSFEVVLSQPVDTQAPDKANILVHGIGVAAQGRGIDPAVALRRFDAFVGSSPLLGFHVAFDRRLIDRAMQAVLGRRLRNPWLDIADSRRCCGRRSQARTLDDWLGAFGIACAHRHQAAADTLATAELLLHLWPAVRPRVRRTSGPPRLAARRRWLQ